MAIDPNRIQSPTDEGADEEEAFLRDLLPFAMGRTALPEVRADILQALPTSEETAQDIPSVHIDVTRDLE